MKNTIDSNNTSVFKKGYIMLVANVFYVFANLGVIKIFLIYDKASWVGEYSLVTSIITPLILFTNLQIKNLTIAHSSSKYHISDFFLARIITSFVLVVVISLIQIFGIVNIHDSPYLLLAVCFYKIIETLSDFALAGLQSKKRTLPISISTFLRSLILLLSSFMSIYFNSCTVGFLIGGLVLLFWNLIFDWNKLFKVDRYNYLKSYIFFRNLKNWHLIQIHFFKIFSIIYNAMPLGLISMLTSYSINITRYMISIILGTKILGIYSSVSYLWFASCFLCITIGEMYLSHASAKLKNKDRFFFINCFKKYTYFSICTCLIGLSVTFFAGDLLLQLLFDKTYEDYIDLLYLFVIFIPISYINYFLSINLTLFGRYNNQLVSNILLNILLIPLCYFLIKLYGINGSIISLIILSILQIVYFISLFFKSINNI